MDTDNPTPESEVSIESRLGAVFAEEDSAQPEAAADEPEAVSTDDETTEEAPVEDTFEFQADDGSTLKLPAAVKEAVLRQQDYTRKTMAVAQLQKQADDRLQYAEAREQISAAVLNDVAELRGLENELKQYQTADWSALYDSNPGQALKFQQVMRDLETKVARKQQEVQAKANHIQQATTKHADYQWAEAENGARQILGNVTAAENAAMLQTITTLGITPQEYKSRFADPRIIALTHKAAKWDALQAGKPAAVKSAQGAPPVVKPGASKGPTVAAEQKYREARAKLGKSGSIQDAARLFLLRGT